MNSLVEEIGRLFPDHEIIVTSRGISALYLALRAIRELVGPGEVIFPATVCPSVALTAIYAGLAPRFCDVELDTFCMSPRTIKLHLSENTRAIVVVHLFGKRADIQGIMKIAQSRDIKVIEDVAQALGGSLGDRMLGSFADFSVLSFNDVKVVPGAAGALLLRDPTFYVDVEQLQLQMPMALPPAAAKELAMSFRNLTHGLYGALRSRGLRATTSCVADMSEFYRPLFVQRQEPERPEIVRTVEGLRRLAENRELRHKRYCEYHTRLDGIAHVITFDDAEICWRLPVLLESHQQQINLLQRIRAAGLLISNHYFPASHVFGDPRPTNAREIGLRAVNFWVDEKVDLKGIETLCRSVDLVCREAGIS